MENLNDVFEETAVAIPDADVIVVELVNSGNGVGKKFDLYPESTLGEVIEVARGPLALGSASDWNFEYNGKTVSDLARTVQEMGLISGSKMIIHPNAKVA